MTRRRQNADLLGLADMFREIRGDYDAAKQTRFKRKRTGMVPTGSGADYHYRTERAYFGAMEFARDLFRNHCLIGQGVRRLVANILGTGFVLDPQTGDDGANAELTARWQDWSTDPEQCDLAGEHDFHTMEQLILQQVLVDGDTLTLPTKFESLQLVEAHRLRTPSGTKKNVVHGVLLDQYRRRQEYWITREDIDSAATLRLVKDIKRYPARDEDGNRQVFHHYMPDRVSQTRGITAFVPAMDTAGMGDDLFFSQLVKAQMASCVTLLRELADGASPGVPGEGQDTTSETRPDGTSRTLAGWQPGMEVFGFPGEKLSGFTPQIPNDTFFQHAMLILTIVAVNLDLPLQVFLLDPTKTNFSGWRGAMDQARQRFRKIQQWLMRSFHSPVYLWKVRRWIDEDSGLRKLLGKPGLNPGAHRWHAPGWPYIEPVKDATDHLIRSRNAQSSERRLAAERGMDWPDLSTEIVDDNALLIEKAHNKAEELNKRYPDLKLSWREVASLPMAEGITVRVGMEAPGEFGEQPESQGAEQ